MHFRTIKDAIALPLHRLGGLLAAMPDSVSRAALFPLGAAAKAGYFLPGSHPRRALASFCAATGRTDPWPIYSRMVDHLLEVGLQFAKLHRQGPAELIANTVADPSLAEQYKRCGNGNNGLIFLVPHCAGSALSSAGLNTLYPITLLVREPRSQARCQLTLSYLEKLGPKFIRARNSPPATVMRNIIRALHERRVVVGTTDLTKAGADGIEVTAFGQRVLSPGWPARLSARLGAPIVPGYIHMEKGKFILLADEGYIEPDLHKCTQRWMTSFEKRITQHPSDWLFMLDKHWSRVLASAADGNRSQTASLSQAEPVT